MWIEVWRSARTGGLTGIDARRTLIPVMRVRATAPKENPMTHASPFVWYELMTSDTDGAAAFYRKVIGWQARPFDPPANTYTLLSQNGVDVAGLMTTPPEALAMGAKPSWGAYIRVDDVDAHVLRVTQARGGVIRAAEDIPGVGRFAVVTDPDGAVFMLFRELDGPPRPPVAPGTPGHVGWHELRASDPEAAFAFYADVFGWSLSETMNMGPMGIYRIFAIDGTASGGIMQKPADAPRPYWLFYLNVDALDAALACATEGGGTLLSEPMEVPGGAWVARCRDPQGAEFAWVAPKR